mmetsp:Transcript_10375/g.20440  ORF Transcript_10375/g.20440 Transcript_10375/m.20440 type:complete len:628 (-) Transcript_10375:168-2051(-)
MSPPSPQSPSFFGPLASIFQDVGLHRSGAPAFVERPSNQHQRQHPNGLGIIGDIWQAEGASEAFHEGNIRSISWPHKGDESEDDCETDTGGNVDVNRSNGDENDEGDDNIDDCSGSSSSSSGGENYDGGGLDVVFRNESPATIVLCFVSESGEPHHFYRLKPSSQTRTKSKSTRQTQNKDDSSSFRMLDTDHLEHTHPGHAFCFGCIESEEQMARVRQSQSLFRRDIDGKYKNKNNKDSKNSNGKRRHDKDEGDNFQQGTSNASSIVVGGYRPVVVSASASASSSSSKSSSSLIMSREIQLVTISHVPAPTKSRRSKLACFRGPPLFCFGGRKVWKKDHDSDDYEDDGSDSDDSFNNTRWESSLDLRGWRVAARWVRTESKPYDTTAKVYQELTMGDWPCCLEPNWHDGDKMSAQKLERDIRAASLLLPPHARAFLQRHCKIWVNRSLSWGPSDCPVKGHGCCYHPGKEWLIKNGLSGDKHMCVEVNNAPHYRKDCDLWGIGGVMLHELSHAYHHGMLPDGYSNKEIQKCYELAMKEGLYDCVKYHSDCNGKNGKMKTSTARAYACTNPMEYFAELSAAFLGGLDETKEYNKWYPFNREQIKKHDPRAYSLLSRLWKVDVGGRYTSR